MMRWPELLAFMKERHSIYLKRVAGKPKPWTDDPILQNYKFVNVFRELDKTTAWVRENIREPHLDHPDMWFMVAMFRQIGWIPTVEELLADKLHLRWDPKKARAIMLDRQARGETLYTGAYMLNAHGRGPDDPSDKAFFTTHLVLNPLWENRKELRKKMHGTMVEAFQAVLPTHGWGPFTAYQFVLDLLHSPGWLDKAGDRDTWAVTGPGGRRGLNRMMGRDLKHPTRPEVELSEMLLLTQEIAKRWPKGEKWGKISIHETEFFLCEFDKYERIRLGEGKMKARYHGTAS